MFISEAYAAAEPVLENAPALSSTLVQLAFILLIFYFLLIRPQQKRVKEHVAMVDALKVGDEVITNSGVHGTVAALDEKTASLEIAPKVVITIERMSISAVVDKAKKDGAKTSKSAKVKKEKK